MQNSLNIPNLVLHRQKHVLWLEWGEKISLNVGILFREVIEMAFQSN